MDTRQDGLNPPSPSALDRSEMSVEQFVAFAERVLAQAGIRAQVALGSTPVDDEEEEVPSHDVSVITDRPYDAWTVLTRQTDAVMERSGPTSITEQLYGFSVVIDSAS
ncbi:MAG TPA: hypothetical protein VEY30_00070 [Myxococcaceae bacterium]|nr:hypothetical protein [Myxococcaceae bacterium]